MAVRNPGGGALGNESVTFPKVQKASVPTPGLENSVTVGFGGVCRLINAAIVGNGTETKFKITHALGTELVGIDIWKEKGTSGSETSPGKWVIVKETTGILSINQIEVIFETAPKAKEVFWVQITG